MPIQEKYDLVIIGGGCAGLSLASRLAEYGDKAPKTLIIEPRTSYTNDRTWCFWDTQQSKGKHIPNKSWNFFEIKYAGKSSVYDCQSAPYQMLRSDQFYQTMLKTIAGNANIQLRLGQKISKNPRHIDHKWYLQLDHHLISSKMIVDTRPAQDILEDDAVLWQSFLGIEVKLKKNVFDPEKLVLMDFDENFTQGLGFVYVLPSSKNRALIEYTVFSKNRLFEQDLAPYLENALSKYLGKNNFEVTHQEHGILPMGNKFIPDQRQESYLRAGLYAGAARPSSGYAFQRIQSWAQQCAESLVLQSKLKAQPEDKKLQQFMDALFLKVIRENQSIAAKIFHRLFQKCDTLSIIRFMSDQASLRECLNIMRSLPTLPFLKALPAFMFGMDSD
jgi:lycopene beta-cyclase